jgi:hypothetical protein
MLSGLSAPCAPRLGGSSSSIVCRRPPPPSSASASAPLPVCSASSRRLARPTAAASDNAAATTKATTTATATAPPEQTRYTRATLRTTDACELAVSVYPFFRYKASGGGGDATVVAAADDKTSDGDNNPSNNTNPHLLRLSFDPASLRVPALDYRTAFLFGVVPIPPPLSIAIRPLALAGTLDARTGEAELSFDAEFLFAAGPLYRAPALRVRTVLTTGSSSGLRLSGTGRRWAGPGAGPGAEASGGGGGGANHGNGDGNGGPARSIRLAGVALVPKTGDAFLDAFLMLPNDALAVLEGELELE